MDRARETLLGVLNEYMPLTHAMSLLEKQMSALHSAGMKVVKVDEAEKEKDGVDD